MRLSRVVLFIMVLPLTLILDLIMFGMLQTCPSCGSFTQFVATEGALSFPIVVGLLEWLRGISRK